METRPTVAILGAGAIGEALASGLLAAGWPADDLVLVARREERRREVEAMTGVICILDPVEAVEGRDVVVVAVKPGDVGGLLGQVAGAIRPDQVVISLAAGVPTTVFEQALGEVPVVRAMPNTPAQIAEAVTALAGGSHATMEAIERAQEVLEAVGDTIVLDESLLDAVTAVSGTGPAYVFLLAEALVEAAIREGLPWHAAEKLVEQTLRGAGMLLAASELSPARLRAQVTSPGGTTAAAVHVLEERGFRALVEDAVRAAARRSREMGERAASPEGV
ncbi:MAG: pyrroline-5-carboxylate reductase [Actinomycetota bacterium]|nr:pyrroline-5-carboxylate reductase [Actinomycetota bacterium]